MSWSARTSEDEIRDRVIDAARRSGLSVGDFVDALSGRGTVDEPAMPRSRRAERPERPAPAGLDRHLDVLSDRLKRLSAVPETERRPKVRARDRAGEADLSEIAAALAGLDRRVRSLAEDRPPIAERRPAPRAEAAPRDDIDRAVAEIAERRRLLDRDERRDRPEPAERAEADLDRHFRLLSEKIDQLRARDERDQTGPLVAEIRALRETIERRTGSGAEVSNELRRLTVKLDDLAATHPARETLEPVMVEIGRLRDAVLQTDVEGSLKSLEAGYGRIVGRLDELKQGIDSPKVGARIDSEISEIQKLLRGVPQIAQVSAIERQLHELDAKIERIGRGDDRRPQDVERRLAEFRTNLERIDPTPMVEALDRRMQVVAERLDAIEAIARGPVSEDHVARLVDEMRAIAAGGRAGDELRAVERRLGELSNRVAAFETRRPTAEDTDRIADRIAEIAERLDGLDRPTIDGRALVALEATIGRLDEMLARQSSTPQADLDARFAEILERLDRDAGAASDVEALTREVAAMRRDLARTPGVADLEAQMRSLAEKLERSAEPEADDETLGQIEDHLERIVERLTSTEARFAGIDGLQDHIRRLDERLEASQTDAVGAAREAARELVLEIGRAGGGDQAVLRALQDDLRSLQSAARETENRTNDTLISLHDALTGIVGRLSAIEKIAQGSARQAAQRTGAAPAAKPAAPAATTLPGFEPIQPPPAPLPQPIPAPATAAADPMPSAAPTVKPAQAEATASATIAGRPVAASPNAVRANLRDLLTPPNEDTRPLEPGSGKPQVRAGQPASRSAPGLPDPDAAPNAAASRKADFIAAARRAAQAAATAAGDVEAPTPADRPAETAAPAAKDEQGGSLARIGRALRARRPLVLATGAVVLTILALKLMPYSGSQPTTARIDEPTAPAAVVATTDGRANETVVSATTPAEAPAPVRVAPKGEAAESRPSPGEAREPTTTGSVAPPTLPSSTLLSMAPRRVDEMRAPAVDGSLLSAPATTGSIPPQAAREPIAPAAAAVDPARTATTPPAATTPSAPVPAPAAPAVSPAMPPEPPVAIGSDALRKAARSGDPKAAFEIGMRLAEGRGVPADARQAFDWYRLAAEAGSVPAQYRLAVAYEKGLGVGRDSDQAKRWYTSAAEAGNVRAMHNLGVLWANARDMNAAIPWFQKAADRGLKDSQFNLGIIHALGSGVRQDLAVSWKWFSLAARQGDKEAEKKQAEIAQHLDRVTLATARMAVQTWVQKPMEQAANDEASVWVEPKPVPQATAPIEPSTATVARVQQMLKASGLYAGPPDGAMSARTRAAIKAWQKKAGVPQTGEIDARLIAGLGGGRSL